MNCNRTTKRGWNVGSFGQQGCAVAVLLLFAATAVGAEPAYVTDRQGQRPEPIVAVDNVCAWPNLTVLRDGTIIASIFGQPSHGTTAGDMECWASEDGGATWTKRGVPAVREHENSNRIHVAAGLANNGDLLAITTGWTGRDLSGKKTGRPFRERIESTWISRSTDGGKTWSVDKSSFPTLPAGEIVVPFGDILPGHDGCLRVAMYHRQRTYVFRSCDDGRTWGEPVTLDEANHTDETALLHLGDGKWLAAARSNGMYLYRSDDDAKTWNHRKKLTDAQQHPGHLTRLSDNRLLVTYGNRTSPGGVDVRFSSDEGLTWSDPLRVVACEGDRGYPSSVQLPDGQVLTAYYAQRIEGHDRNWFGCDQLLHRLGRAGLCGHTRGFFADRFMQTDFLQQIQGGQQIELIDNERELRNRVRKLRVPSSKGS